MAVAKVGPSTHKGYRTWYNKRYEQYGMRLLTDSLGTVRRLQALMVIGYTTREMGDALGMERTNLGRLMHNRRGASKVHVETARKVAEFYDAHSHLPVFNTYAGKRARTFALKSGWVPPMAWDDIDDPNEIRYSQVNKKAS